MLSQEKVRAKTTVKITTVGPRASTGLSGGAQGQHWVKRVEIAGQVGKGQH